MNHHTNYIFNRAKLSRLLFKSFLPDNYAAAASAVFLCSKVRKGFYESRCTVIKQISLHWSRKSCQNYNNKRIYTDKILLRTDIGIIYIWDLYKHPRWLCERITLSRQ